VAVISHFINFEVRGWSDYYIPRGGRTGRAGAVGEVITFVSPAEEERLCGIEKTIGTTLPRVVLPNFDPGVHVHVPPPVGAPRPGGRRRRRRAPG
jgi:ATP-dependent RNA helicase RhlE